MQDEEYDFHLVYWILKLHKCPYKQRYITEFAKCFLPSLFLNFELILGLLPSSVIFYLIGLTVTEYLFLKWQ